MDSSDSSTQERTRHVKLSQFDLTCTATSSTRSLRLSTQEIELVRHGAGKVGSVVVCEVISLGAHKQIENPLGDLVSLTPGNLIMGVIGHRHSTVSMYGGLPESGINLPGEEPVDLLSSGGVIGECYSCPSYLGSPTKLRILGLASQAGNLLEARPRLMDEKLEVSCPLILMAGTSSGVGKTRFAAKLVKFISRNLGRQVAATKLTGAGSLEDALNLEKAGAKQVFHLVDAGLVTTYGIPGEQVVSVSKGILNQLGIEKPGVIIAELGGDIFGANVPAILADPEIQESTRAMILLPSDIFAASGALTYLRRKEIDFPLKKVYIGQPMKNPLASQERAWQILDRRPYDCEKAEDLADLIKEVLGWGNDKDDQAPQTGEQGMEQPAARSEIFHRLGTLEELSFSSLKGISS